MWLTKKRSFGWLIDNYIFIRNDERITHFTLRCQKKNASCTVRATIDKETGVAESRPGEHTHPPPDPDDIEFKVSDDSADSDKKKKRMSSTSKTPKTPKGKANKYIGPASLHGRF